MLVKWNKVTNCNWKGKRDKNYSHLWKVTLCYFRTNWNFSTLFYICEWPTNFHENQYHHIRHSCIKIIKYSSIPVESYPRTNGNNFLLDVRKTAAAELKTQYLRPLETSQFRLFEQHRKQTDQLSQHRSFDFWKIKVPKRARADVRMNNKIRLPRENRLCIGLFIEIVGTCILNYLWFLIRKA